MQLALYKIGQERIDRFHRLRNKAYNQGLTDIERTEYKKLYHNIKNLKKNSFYKEGHWHAHTAPQRNIRSYEVTYPNADD